MSEHTKRQQNRRRKKKSKFGYYLYAVTVLLLTIVNITIAILLLTQVQAVVVEGNHYSSESEIVEWMEEDPLTFNSLYTLWKFRFGAFTLPAYLEDVDVRLDAPWKVHVKVQEKQMIGGLLLGDSYVYFDSEGLILQKGNQYNSELPLIEGLQVENAENIEEFTQLEVDNKKVFSYIVKVTKEIEEASLSPDRIVWEDDSMNLYFEGICVKLGKSNFDVKILQLPPILEQLEGNRGILHMEHYTEDSTSISFEKNDEES